MAQMPEYQTDHRPNKVEMIKKLKESRAKKAALHGSVENLEIAEEGGGRETPLRKLRLHDHRKADPD